MPSFAGRTALALAVIIIIIAINNTAYYFSTKAILTGELEENMKSVAEQMRMAIDQSVNGQAYVESLLAQQLRAASIAVKYALDPDIANVSNRELETLRDELSVANISLLQQTDGQFVSTRWTEPDRAHLGAIRQGERSEALERLLSGEPAEAGLGQSLPGFWASPFEKTGGDPDDMQKRGYFYDGSANYVISASIGPDGMRDFNEQFGPDAVAAKLLEQYAFLREITVFNHGVFGKEAKIQRGDGHETWLHLKRNPILYGTYRMADAEQDLEGVGTAMEQNRIVTRQIIRDGQRLYRMYVPVQNPDIPYVIGITADQAFIRDRLNDQFRFLALIVLTGSLLSIVIIIAAVRLFETRRDIAVRKTQEAYIHEVNELFTTIRGQRHDFLNQVQTIHTMATLNKWEDLKAFTAELIGEIRVINDIINIGNPALAALIQAKVVSAANRKIHLVYDISDLKDVKLGIKSVDIVKIIGNLVDNAFDEVASLPEPDRRVDLFVQEKDTRLHIRVSNPGRVISDTELENMLQSGYTTRTDGEHHGLGLAIIRERVRHYRGNIRLTNPPEGGLAVDVFIPLQ